MENEEAHYNGAHGSDARPYGVGRAEWQVMGGAHEQRHTKEGEHEETANPKPMVGAGLGLGLAKAEREPTFA